MTTSDLVPARRAELVPYKRVLTWPQAMAVAFIGWARRYPSAATAAVMFGSGALAMLVGWLATRRV